MRPQFETAGALGALLGLAAHYRHAGWSYKAAMARAEELLPLRGQEITPEWTEEFWRHVDHDMGSEPPMNLPPVSDDILPSRP